MGNDDKCCKNTRKTLRAVVVKSIRDVADEAKKPLFYAVSSVC
jgi:hypothetical protein